MTLKRIATATTNPRRGVTLLEIMVAMPIILVSASLMAGTLLAATRQRTVNGESARAAEVLRSRLESMRNEDIRLLIALYDEDPFNDPGGPGTAPGASFAIDGLTPVTGDADGLSGEVLMPLTDTAPVGSVAPQWELREDMDDPGLGMPCDLNGDGVIDDQSHSADYRILPVTVVARWKGRFGPRTLRMHTLFTEYRY